MSKLTVRDVPSPNHNERPAGVPISAVVLHADSSSSAAGSVAWVRKSKADLLALWKATPKSRRPAKPWSPVSYHDIVDRDGTIFALVPWERRAWHAGASEFRGVEDCNDYCIGLSFSNTNTGEPYTDAQYEAGAKRVAAYMLAYPTITLDRVTTHALVAPGRKTDPYKFDLPRFMKLVGQSLTCSVEES